MKVTRETLTREKLTTLVLAEIRTFEGCDGVKSVVIMENSTLRAASNWQIAIVVTKSDPQASHAAAAEVQRRLSERYQLS